MTMPGTSPAADSRTYAYLRVSTDEQATSGLGREAQLARIRAEVDRRGWTLADVIADDGVSGGTDPDERPALGPLLARLTPGDVVVVAKLDRLARSALAFLDLADRAESEGWSLVVLDLGLDMTTPMGRFTATILAAVAELERSLISQRTREALAAKRARGERVGRERQLCDDALARIVSLRADGLSLRQIARTLEAEGIRTATGCERWYASTVSTALASWRYERELAAAAADTEVAA